MTFGNYYFQTSFMYSVDHTMVFSSQVTFYSIFQIHVEILILISKDLTFIFFLASGDFCRLLITFATSLDQDP